MFCNQPKADTTVPVPVRKAPSLPNLSAEIRSLYPEMKGFSLAPSVVQRLDSLQADSLKLMIE
ncbi:hypothetical protein V9K67_26340 [Paraflavisolibacter sp. H34]|uniref:hypothetical protein n=1 Tax=Huijunlia imazamoxiresistens TaxID=3127457 RepID=UPI0030185133